MKIKTKFIRGISLIVISGLLVMTLLVNNYVGNVWKEWKVQEAFED